MGMNETPTIHDQYQPNAPHFSKHTHTTSSSSSSTSSAPSRRSRASSATVHPTPSTSASRQGQAHIKFSGAPKSQNIREDLISSSESSPHANTQTSRPQDVPPPSPRLQPTHPSTASLNSSVANSPSRIKIRDLNHIQSFASEDFLTRSRHQSKHSLRGRLEGVQQYEISEMPVTDIIEMVAGLLTKITTQNDRQHENLRRHVPPSSEASSGLNQQTTSILAFHGKNVPTITINSYLMRIHKYCPTTYEVFLGLLIYFDRMTEMINQGRLHSFTKDEKRQTVHRTTSADSTATVQPDSPNRMSMSPPPEAAASPEPANTLPAKSQGPAASLDLVHHFVVDSFNIHRLVMAGVTCASKFFSDVFYTNSRYAKVGGLPLAELNHLELQFLLLNDFRLSISLEDLESYGTRLVDFYMEEIVIQQHQQKGLNSPVAGSGDDGIYMKMG